MNEVTTDKFKYMCLTVIIIIIDVFIIKRLCYKSLLMMKATKCKVLNMVRLRSEIVILDLQRP